MDAIGLGRFGGGRAGEMRITRFLHNAAGSVSEMMETGFVRTARGIHR